jgi:hypothetical protein
MGIMNGAINMWKKMCSNLLIMSRKTSNFVEQAHTERKAYNNLIRQQSVLLDEYEDLIKAYDENNKKAGSDTIVILCILLQPVVMLQMELIKEVESLIK